MIQKIKNFLWHLPKSYFYSAKNGFPSQKLTLIGITGTDGKTTTSTLVYEILKRSGIKCGLMTTIGAKIGDKEVDTGLHMTSPDPQLVQKIFKDMVAEGITHAVVEVTAHALDQYRFGGCEFKVGVLTNISQEHMDYFPNKKGYIDTKLKLLKSSEVAVVNADDESYPMVRNLGVKTLTYGVKKGNLKAEKIRISPKEMSFEVDGQKMVTDSNYNYQVYNILAALGVARALNIDWKLVKEVIRHFPETKGRREEVENEFKFRTLVDFAHTPAALEATLTSLRQQTKGRLLVIFGATGGRDRIKRPMMGKVVSLQADIAFITADDTREEKIEEINLAIISGINQDKSQKFEQSQIGESVKVSEIQKAAEKKFVYFDIPVRQDAFNLAVRLAEPGDIIVACGKGHERTILHGKTEYPWSEAEAFRTAFRMKKLG